MKKQQFWSFFNGKQYSIKLEMYLWDLLKVKISAEPARVYIKNSMRFAHENNLPLTQTVRQFVVRKISREDCVEDADTRAPAGAVYPPAGPLETRGTTHRAADQQSEDE